MGMLRDRFHELYGGRYTYRENYAVRSLYPHKIRRLILCNIHLDYAREVKRLIRVLA